MKHLEASKGYGNHLLDTARPISMLLMTHLSCNWYVTKTLVYIPLGIFCFSQNIFLFRPHIVLRKMLIYVHLPSLSVWFMNSNVPPRTSIQAWQRLAIDSRCFSKNSRCLIYETTVDSDEVLIARLLVAALSVNETPGIFGGLL